MSCTLTSESRVDQSRTQSSASKLTTLTTRRTRYHTTPVPTRNITAGITHVITAFAQSTIFTTDSQTFDPAAYTPFRDLASIRALFDPGVKVCMSIGGWGDTAGFRVGATNDTSRRNYAKNINATLHHWGYDCAGRSRQPRCATCGLPGR